MCVKVCLHQVSLQQKLTPLLLFRSKLIIKKRLLIYNSDITWLDQKYDQDISLLTEENSCINETIFWSLLFLRYVTQLESVMLMLSRMKKYSNSNFFHKRKR